MGMNANAAGMTLDPRTLQSVVALADELHFKRAAAKLYVSQPALSATLKNLERALGVQLFSRDSRHVELTAAGKVFADEARSLIAQGERLVKIVRGQASEVSGPLRAGYAPSINLHWISLLVARAREEIVSTQVEFLSLEPVTLTDLLLNGELDAALLMGRPRHPELHTERLFVEPLSVVLPYDHPLVRRDGLAVQDLKDEPVIWLRRDLNPWLHESFLQECGVHGYHPNVAQEVTTFHECLHFARQGLGITFLPSSILPSSMSNGFQDEAIIRAEFPKIRIDVTLAYRCDARHAALKQLIELAHSCRTDSQQADAHRASGNS
jgi:DNA-binding transcriptional LysR family regulator